MPKARRNETPKPQDVALTPRRTMSMDHAILQLDLGDTCRRVSTANRIRGTDLPWMKSCCFSRESSSDDLSLVSSSNQVDPMPINVTPANIPRLGNPHHYDDVTIGRANTHIVFSVLSELPTLKNIIWETMAPSSHAAEIPCAVER